MSLTSDVILPGDPEAVRYPISLVTPGSVAAYARRPETRRELLRSMEKLEHDDIDRWRMEVLRTGFERIGESWDFQDNVTIAHAFTALARPTRAIEVGVRRGLLSAMVAAANPSIELHLVDMWIENYSGSSNPGKELVRRQLSAVGHTGEVRFYEGDSHKILPELLGENPELDFDVVVIDGDHTYEGAFEDLRHLVPRVAPGGILIFDDIAHECYPYLLDLWRRWMSNTGLLFRSEEYGAYGHGVGWAIKASCAPVPTLELHERDGTRNGGSLKKFVRDFLGM